MHVPLKFTSIIGQVMTILVNVFNEVQYLSKQLSWTMISVSDALFVYCPDYSNCLINGTTGRLSLDKANITCRIAGACVIDIQGWFSNVCATHSKFVLKTWLSFLFPQNPHSIFICQRNCNVTRLTTISMHKTIRLSANIILMAW